MERHGGVTEPLARQPGDFDPRALRRLRFRAGLSQEELAGACGISRVRITQIENPNLPDAPSARLFRALADALGVEPERLEVPGAAIRTTRKAGAGTSAA